MTLPQRSRTFLQFALMLAILSGVLLIQHGASFRDFSTPLSYNGDVLSHALLTKTVLDTGWFGPVNPFLGAPFGADAYDYPMSEGAHLLLFRLLGMFGDWAFVMNAFFVLGYYLVAAAAFWVLRRFGLASPWPLVGGLLFTFLPFHALRLEHLFLSAYYAVPLGVWLAWIVSRGLDPERLNQDRIAMGVCGVIVGAAGVYYAFFTCYLVAMAMLVTMVAGGRAGSLRRGVVVLALVGGTVFANVLPSIIYHAAHGPNPEVATRHFSDPEDLGINLIQSETYGLKITQLVLPRGDHRIAAASAIAERYAAASAIKNESNTSSLGLVACIGFIYLLWHALRKLMVGGRDQDLPDSLAAFNIAALLLGTVGGFGTLFAFFVSPQIRSYNRVSLVIAFVSIAGLLAVTAKLAQGLRAKGEGTTVPYASWFVAAVIVGAGIFDQTAPSDLAPAPGAFRSDREFVRGLEAGLPQGAAVYQMPYHKYPEAGTQFEISNYGPALGYLHSKALRWSYGHMKGRDGDRWMTALNRLPVTDQAARIAESGFSAIVLDRRGYADKGIAAEAALRAALGAPIAESGDGKMVAFAVQPTGNTAVSYEALQVPFERVDFSSAQLPNSVLGLGGFSGWEPWGRWTDAAIARIELGRSLPRSFVLGIQTEMAIGKNVDAPIVVAIGGVEHEFKVGAKTTKLLIPFELQGPAKVIEFRIPNPVSPAALGLSGDSRPLGIGIKSLWLEPR